MKSSQSWITPTYYRAEGMKAQQIADPKNKTKKKPCVCTNTHTENHTAQAQSDPFIAYNLMECEIISNWST